MEFKPNFQGRVIRKLQIDGIHKPWIESLDVNFLARIWIGIKVVFFFQIKRRICILHCFGGHLISKQFPRYHITKAHYVLGIYIGSTSNAHFVAFARSTGCLSVVSENRRRYRKLQYFLFSYMHKGDGIYFMTTAKVIKLRLCIFW